MINFRLLLGLSVFTVLTIGCSPSKSKQETKPGSDTSQSADPTPVPTPEVTPTPVPITSCPVNYEKVQANSKIGTKAFCIAKFEMKNISGVASSMAANKPWLANKNTASAACTQLGSRYRLPTNSEWNAVALEIYNQNDNWFGGGKNQNGKLYSGLYSEWGEPIAINNENDPYDGVKKKNDSERRVFRLASGNIIWDFGGNAWEWVSDVIYGNSYTPDLSQPYGRKYNNNTWDVTPGSKALFDFTGMSAAPSKEINMGLLFGGNSGGVIRGGSISMHAAVAVGIFTANIGDITADGMQAPASWDLKVNNIGFRCLMSLD